MNRSPLGAFLLLAAAGGMGGGRPAFDVNDFGPMRPPPAPKPEARRHRKSELQKQKARARKQRKKSRGY